MIEQGKIIKVNGNYAAVSISKKEECEKCGMCLFSKNANSIEVSAENKLSAKVGDEVLCERVADGKFLGAILCFLVPLLLIGLACLINYLFINVEIWILLLSLVFIVLWYTILAVIDKKLKNKQNFKFIITEIVNNHKENNE
ncbi:MAG: SoxR reducing system RseC family protein [Clostridia bacterium]|nr:SoxR reducing system RseC family protein [Clostridia bacterium]